MALLSYAIPYDTYEVGSANIVESSIPDGATSLHVTVDVTGWTDPLSILDIAMDFSLDDGLTWLPGGRAPIQSGPDGLFHKRDGSIATQTVWSASWPDGVTLVKGSVTVSGAQTTFGCTVDIN